MRCRTVSGGIAADTVLSLAPRADSTTSGEGADGTFMSLCSLGREVFAEVASMGIGTVNHDGRKAGRRRAPCSLGAWGGYAGVQVWRCAVCRCANVAGVQVYTSFVQASRRLISYHIPLQGWQGSRLHAPCMRNGCSIALNLSLVALYRRTAYLYPSPSDPA
jgi:hypothetical protein